MKLSLLFKILLLIFSPFSIFSESYSSYRLDDSLYIDNGIRKFVYGTRFDLIHISAQKSNEHSEEQLDSSQTSWGWNVYSNGNHLTQKGGRQSNQTSFYKNFAIISPEIYSRFLFVNLDFFYVGSLSGFRKENRKSEVEKDLGIDAESLFGVKLDTFYIQAGRGFYRTDKCGFLLNAFVNFIEGVYFRSIEGFYIEFRGVLGNTNSDKQDFSGELWNRDKRSIYGGFIRGSSVEWKLDWNVFTVIQRRPKQFPSYLNEFRPGEDYKYFGVEFGKDIVRPLSLDFGGISWISMEDRYIPWILQEDSTVLRTGILYYITLDYKLNEKNALGVGGIMEKNHRFPDIHSRNRFLGGDSSILLNLRENPKFLPLDLTKNTSVEGGGIFWTQKLLSIHGYSASLKWNVNTISSYYGLGWEGIASFSLESDHLGFFLISFAHARIQPNASEGLVIEEIQIPLKEDKYERIFISGGIVF